MKISIVGAGHVGVIIGIGFTELGNEVIFIDLDEKIVDSINSAKPPMFEKGLKELMEKNRDKYRASREYWSLKDTDITFICVNTCENNGSVDLTCVESASREIGKVLKNKDEFHVVVVKSTVVPGTTEGPIKFTLEHVSGKKAFKDFGLAVNPEFLREGSAINDFFNSDRIVVGFKDDRTRRIIEEIYSSFHCPKLFTDLSTAEMIKLASNAFLAMKISFANEIGNICKRLGIDSYEVFKGIGLDHRINQHYLRAGIGFGGSCLAKDVRALIKKAEEIKEDTRLLKAVIDINYAQPMRIIGLLKKHLPSLRGKRIGVLGLAFKPGTDDVRESRAIPIIETLIKEGAEVLAYDPKATENFSKIFPQIEYVSIEEVLEADAIIIITEWEEFETLDYRGKVVIDGRRIEKARKEAKIYEGICW